MVDVMAIAMRMEVEGASTVQAVLNRLRADMDKTEDKARGLDRALASIGDELKGLVAGLGIVAVFSKIAAETSEAEFAQAQLAAALKSTGNVAAQTVDGLNEHAAALARVSVFDDDVISGAQALLLTFTQIRGPIFRDATQAILNVAQAMGTDLRSATIQVGKALNDPILGLTALSRAGIQFSEAQKETIKQLMETNRIVDAQRVILAELDKQFAGSAEAARNTFGGALKGLQNDIGNLLTISGPNAGGAANVINRLADAVRGLNSALTDILAPLSRFVDLMERLPLNIADNLRRLTPFLPLLQLLIARGREASEVAQQVQEATTGGATGGASAQTTPPVVTATASLVSQLIDLARVLPLTTAQHAKLEAEQQRLTLALASGNQSLTQRIELAKTLHDVEKALADATVTRSNAEVAASVASLESQRAQIMGRSVQTVTREGQAKAQPMVLPQAVIDNIRRTMQQFDERINTEMGNSIVAFRAAMAAGFAISLAEGLAAGFETAFATGSITQGFKALTGAMLSGLGSMLVQFGTKALIANQTIQNMFANMFTPGPQGIAAAAAIIAIGSGLVAAGRSIGAGAAGATNRSAPAMAGGGFGTGGSMTLPSITFGPTTARSASNIVPTSNNTFNIIGVNDPSAQRQLQEMLRNADRRGGTTTV